jgi:hypothetical protein
MRMTNEDKYIESLTRLTRKDWNGLKKGHEELVGKVMKNPEYRHVYNETRFKIELGFKARHIRETEKMTQTQIAELLNTKQAYIARLEHGSQNVTIHTLWKYATACGKQLKISFVNNA